MKKELFIRTLILLGILLAASTISFYQIEKDTRQYYPMEIIENYNGINLEMIKVQGGYTLINPKANDSCKYFGNIVKVQTFYISKYEITTKQWEAIYGRPSIDYKNVDSIWDSNISLYSISWNDANLFVQELSQKSLETYSLPTELEWEYAASGGRKSNGNIYSGSDFPDSVAWFNNNRVFPSIPGNKKSNELGIYDMSGNVSEWCSDWYREDRNSFYFTNELINQGTDKVIKGGNIVSSSNQCKINSRGFGSPNFRNPYNGLRIVRRLSD